MNGIFVIKQQIYQTINSYFGTFLSVFLTGKGGSLVGFCLSDDLNCRYFALGLKDKRNY
jgi:hypothetical protein